MQKSIVQNICYHEEKKGKVVSAVKFKNMENRADNAYFLRQIESNKYKVWKPDSKKLTTIRMTDFVVQRAPQGKTISECLGHGKQSMEEVTSEFIYADDIGPISATPSRHTEAYGINRDAASSNLGKYNKVAGRRWKPSKVVTKQRRQEEKVIRGQYACQYSCK